MSDELKLYVWENVLKDYTAGIVCVAAESEKQAWERLYEEDSTAWWALNGNETPPREVSHEGNKSRQLKTHLELQGEYKTTTATEPREVTDPEAFAVWGGG